MQPASSPGALAVRRAGVDPRVQLGRIRFRRALALMVMTLLLPGSAQLVAGNRKVGRIALRVWMGTIAFGVLLFLLGMLFDSFLFWFASNSLTLGLVRFGLMGMAIGWTFLFIDAWRLGNPLNLRQKQRLAMVGINGMLCFSVAGSLLFAAHVASAGNGLLNAMFTSGDAEGATHGRYNVMILGADTGADRWGTRIDSINVASIDAETGEAVLIGMPRNLMRFPFAKGSTMAKQFPDGYDGEDGLINSLSTYAANHKDLFKGARYPGVEATRQAVEGVTGLEVHYFAMVNLQGFEKMVDAVGGITINVRDRIPIGGGSAPVEGYIEPGVRKLDGFKALWFARSRESSDDYARMARQKCVLNAMLQQLNPRQVLMNVGEIANASKALVTTDLPRGEVDRFVQLALKAKSQPIRSVSLVPPLIRTNHPDVDVIQKAIQKAIDGAEGKGKKKESAEAAPKERGTVPPPPKKSEPSTSVGGAVGNLNDGYAANQAQNLGAYC